MIKISQDDFVKFIRDNAIAFRVQRTEDGKVLVKCEMEISTTVTI